jgi:hypothetical protein
VSRCIFLVLILRLLHLMMTMAQGMWHEVMRKNLAACTLVIF